MMEMNKTKLVEVLCVGVVGAFLGMVVYIAALSVLFVLGLMVAPFLKAPALIQILMFGAFVSGVIGAVKMYKAFPKA